MVTVHKGGRSRGDKRRVQRLQCRRRQSCSRRVHRGRRWEGRIEEKEKDEHIDKVPEKNDARELPQTKFANDNDSGPKLTLRG